MKNYWIAILILAFISCSEDEGSPIVETPQQEDSFEGEISWRFSYGGSGDDIPQSVISTSDGGLAILGYSNSTDGDLEGKSMMVNDYWLLRLDADGNKLWSRTYGGSKDDKGQAVIQTTDGGFAIVGYAMSDDGDSSQNQGFHDNWILKLDSGGNIEWERSVGYAGHDHSYDLVQTADGGYLFVGFLDVDASGGEGNIGKGPSIANHGVGEFWSTKLDAEGQLQWQRYFGGSNNDRSHGLVEAHNGGYLLTGFSESEDFDISDPKGSYDFWLVRLDEKGSIQWEKNYGGSEIEVSFDLARTPDGAYVIAGHTFSSDQDVSTNHGESDFWLIKVDDAGEVLWEKTFGGSGFELARDVFVSEDGTIFICGNSKSSDQDVTENFGENDIWAVATDSGGNLIWQRSFGGSGLDFGHGIIQTSDGGLVLVGEMGSADWDPTGFKGGIDLAIIKLQ